MVSPFIVAIWTVALVVTLPEPKHPTWTSISKIEAHEDLASSDSLLFAKDMIKNCQENHDRCKPIAQEDPFMPRRILDLGTFDPSATTLAETMPVTLVETIHISPFEPYVTLSHRWGPPGTTITTLSQNIESHKSQSGIAFEKLSVAFQDTVYILRRLGIRYLWIDSLCIIQHDLEDWREQSKSMAKIYDRALFTIAWQCGHGKSIRNLRIPYQLTDVRSAVPVFARLKTEHLYGERRTKYFPLLSRGWVYQERLLSRRTLHVTERELMWRCLTRTYDDHSSETIYARWLDGISKGGEGQQERALEENWQKMITEYSDLKLTKQYDRLVAIQGCADQIQRISGQQYFKGL
ncbi:HET-domain-containing protein, partial [Massarina eburnea CBS 473.64]